MSIASPRCNFCGAALKDGDLDWAAMQSKSQAEYIEANKNQPRLRPLLTKVQRTAAIRLLYTGPAGAEIPMLHEITESFAHDYAELGARKSDRCHFGKSASRLIRVEWTFDIDFGAEYNVGHAAFLLVGIIAWSKKRMTSEFSTYHVACPICAETDFASKSAFEKAIEPVPAPLRRKRHSASKHFAIIAAQSGLGAIPAEEVEEARFYLIVEDCEKGAFSASQLVQLVESGRVSMGSTIRIEGAVAPVTVESILKK